MMETLAQRVLAGEARALARAISLVEDDRLELREIEFSTLCKVL